MRRPAPVILVLLAAVTSLACSLIDPPSEDYAAAGPIPTGPPFCDFSRASVAWGELVSEPIATGVMRYTITKTGERSAEIVDQERVAETTIDTFAPTDPRADWIWEQARNVVGTVLARTPSSKISYDIPKGLTRPIVQIRYEAVTQITLPLTFKCGSVPEVKTMLRTWIKPVVVVYTCGQDAAKYPVQAAYCAR